MNNKILTKKQLLQQISCLIDDYVTNALERKTEYEFVGESHTPSSEFGEMNDNQEYESDLVSNDENDNVCMAFLTNGKRCSRERHLEGPDTELCKFHNNKKFEGRLEKVIKGGPSQKKMKRYKKPVKKDDEEVEVQEIKLIEDEDGDMVDQNGSIWDVETETIIGKKDLVTKEKLFFKKI